MTPIILHIETSTFEGSIALSQGNKLLREVVLPSGEKYVKTLASSIDILLQDADVSRDQLEAIAISSGPGSYTGLRIGASLCKGLAHGLNIPLIVVPTLEILARAVFEKYAPDLAIPLMDARRMEVYTAAYQRDLNIALPTTALVIDENSFEDFLGKRCVFAGNGSEKCRQLLEAKPEFVVDGEIALAARFMVDSAVKAFKLKEFESVESFEPFYLKEFQIGKSSKISTILKG